MAKKGAVKLIIQLDSEFKVLVPKELKSSFEKDLKRGELSMSVDNVVGSMEFNRSIYPDHVKEGALTFSEEKNDYWHVSVKGFVTAELDPSFDKELIDALADGKSLPALMNYVSDNDCNWYHIDGDDSKTIEIGTTTLG